MKIFCYCLLITAISWISNLANAQTLPEAARQERERRKGAESRAVFTNESTSAAARASAPASAPPATTAKPDTGKASAASGRTDNKGRDEKYWRDTFDKARQDLKRADDKLKLLDLKSNDLSAQLLREGIYTREMELRAELDKARKEQEITRKEVAGYQQTIRDLEDELRRSGGLPGWAR